MAALKSKVLSATALAEKYFKQYVTVRKTNLAYRSKIKRLRNSSTVVMKGMRGRLRKDQFAALQRRSTRGLKWSSATIKDGLQFKMKWGTKGYSDFVKKVPIYPSARKLQQAVEHLPFESGFLHEVYESFKGDVADMKPQDLECFLVGDELAIEAGEVFDPSTGKMIGSATFPHHTGLAKKAFILLLVSLTRKFKRAVAYYLTSSAPKADGQGKGEGASPCGTAMMDIILDIVRKYEAIGIRISIYISDMGPDNRAGWKAFNVGYVGPLGQAVFYVQHPTRPEDKLWIIPDTVHLFKNILPALCNNKIIRLPEDVIAEEGLSSAEVKYEHIDGLLNFEKQYELKLAFRLQEKILHGNNQYSKMKVSSSSSVFNRRTQIALLAKAGVDNDESVRTTAFFVGLVTEWFDYVSNRGAKLSLSKKNPKEYEKALRHIRRTADIFARMKIGDAATKRTGLKPLQLGMMMACGGLIEIQEYLLEKRNFVFVLLGLITQDCLENVNSLLRYIQASPNALHLKQNLKVITLTQMCLTAKNTNYSIDVVEGCVPDEKEFDFLAHTRQVADAKKVDKELASFVESSALYIPQVSSNEVKTQIDEWEMCVIYNFAGSTLRSLKKMNISKCSDCLDALTWRGDGSHPYALMMGLLEQKTGCLLSVSDECFQAALKAEVTFRRSREVLRTVQHINAVTFLVNQLMYVWEGTRVPSCHNITSKFLQRFLTMRFKMYGVQSRKGNDKKALESVKYTSKTMGMRAAVM